MDGHRGTGGGGGQEQGGIVAELKSQLPNVMYAVRLRTMSRRRGARRGMYVCMYVCAYGSRWHGMHVQHISLLSCITYLVLSGDVRSLLQEERTKSGMAMKGCIMEGRPPHLQ